MIPEQHIKQDEVMNKYNYHGKYGTRAKHQKKIR